MKIFGVMLDREDLDAVYIATPDHWHCAIAVQAARMGKHIYGQKPLALTVGEGRRIADTVKTTGIVWQTGQPATQLRVFPHGLRVCPQRPPWTRSENHRGPSRWSQRLVGSGFA